MFVIKKTRKDLNLLITRDRLVGQARGSSKLLDYESMLESVLKMGRLVCVRLVLSSAIVAST